MKKMYVAEDEDHVFDFEVDDDAVCIQICAAGPDDNRITWVDFANKKYSTYSYGKSTVFDFPAKPYQVRKISCGNYVDEYI